jgi:hypothetical protein
LANLSRFADQVPDLHITVLRLHESIPMQAVVFLCRIDVVVVGVRPLHDRDGAEPVVAGLEHPQARPFRAFLSRAFQHVSHLLPAADPIVVRRGHHEVVARLPGASAHLVVDALPTEL